MLGIDIDAHLIHFQVEEIFLRISWTYENITPCRWVTIPWCCSGPQGSHVCIEVTLLDCDLSLHSAVEEICDPYHNADDIFEPVGDIVCPSLLIMITSRSLALLFLFTSNFRLTLLSQNHQYFPVSS